MSDESSDFIYRVGDWIVIVGDFKFSCGTSENAKIAERELAKFFVLSGLEKLLVNGGSNATKSDVSR
jgi:hypothetical protein